MNWTSVARHAASLALYCTGVHLLHPQPLDWWGVLGAGMVAWSGVVMMLRGKERYK
jgi:hypothetical protein